MTSSNIDRELRIREAKIEDAVAIVEMLRDIATKPGFFSSQPSEITLETVIDTISNVGDGSGICLVVEAKGKLVGLAFLTAHHKQSLQHVSNLDALAVHLGWQRKGIGTKLLTQVIEWARQSKKTQKIELNVRASNFGAISLYKKMGFEEEGRLKNRVKVDNDYVDDIVMGLDLGKRQLQGKGDVNRVMKISHITFICKNIEKTGIFLKQIFGAIEYYSTKEDAYSLSKEKFFKINDALWIVAMEGEPIFKTYNHLAFKAEATEFPRLHRELEKLGLEILPGRNRRTEEGESMYFYDYDNHLFEFHSGNINDRLRYYQALDAQR